MADPVGEALLRLREYARNRDIASLLREAQKSSGVSTVRSAAIRRLGNLRDPRALGAVAEIARSEKDHGLRVMAVRALSRRGFLELGPGFLERHTGSRRNPFMARSLRGRPRRMPSQVRMPLTVVLGSVLAAAAIVV